MPIGQARYKVEYKKNTDDNALMSTCTVVLMFKAIMKDGRAYPLYVNPNRNSHNGLKPLRLWYCSCANPDTVTGFYIGFL